MKITAIRQQQKLKNRYAIFVDDKYSFSLSDSALLENHLNVGQELTREELQDLKRTAESDKLYSKVLHYISIRPRSEWEIVSYLEKNKSPTSLSQEILNKLSKYDLLNDRLFAQLWIENRRLLRPISKRRLINELRIKRISDEIIKETMESDESDELSEIKKIIESKRKQTRYKDDLKLKQYLMRQGFNYEDIKAAFRDD